MQRTASKGTMNNGCDEQDIHDTSIACLPPEVLSVIFSMLDVPSRLSVTLVCRTWQQVAQHVTKWPDTLLVLDVPRLARLHHKSAPHMQKMTSVCLYQSQLNYDRGFITRDIHLKYFSQNYTHMVALELAHCHELTDATLIFIADYLTHLKHLDILQNKLITDEGFRHLSGCNDGLSHPRLEVLRLTECLQLTDLSLLYLSMGQNRSLRILSIEKNHLIGNEGLSHLVHMTNLRELNLVYCAGITAMGLFHLATIQKLQVRDCFRVGEEALEIIAGTATGLKSLTLDVTMLTETGLDLVVQILVNLGEFVVGGYNYIGGILQLRDRSIDATELRQEILVDLQDKCSRPAHLTPNTLFPAYIMGLHGLMELVPLRTLERIEIVIDGERKIVLG